MSPDGQSWSNPQHRNNLIWPWVRPPRLVPGTKKLRTAESAVRKSIVLGRPAALRDERSLLDDYGAQTFGLRTKIGRIRAMNVKQPPAARDNQ